MRVEKPKTKIYSIYSKPLNELKQDFLGEENCKEGKSKFFNNYCKYILVLFALEFGQMQVDELKSRFSKLINTHSDKLIKAKDNFLASGKINGVTEIYSLYTELRELKVNKPRGLVLTENYVANIAVLWFLNLDPEVINSYRNNYFTELKNSGFLAKSRSIKVDFKDLEMTKSILEEYGLRLRINYVRGRIQSRV